MTLPRNFTFDPTLDLMFTREVAVPRRLVWKAWTEPKHLMPWFCPKPWSVTDCRIDLAPGGEFFTEMRSPEGQAFPNSGCYLEVLPEERLVWTDALLPGFRPSGKAFMTGMICLEDSPTGTRYTAIARHSDDATRKQHEDMGFHGGWGTALDQLVDYMKGMM